MKIYPLIIFSILFIYIQNECAGSDGISGTKDCTNRELSFMEKSSNYKHCCYLYGISDNEIKQRCIPITKDEYEDIETTIDYKKSVYSCDIKAFDCKSSYNQIGLLALLFLLY